MKIGILQTGRAPDEMVDSQGDYDQLFAVYLDGRGFTFETFAVLDGDFPNGPHDADGWLITGSRHGAYEDHAWIPPLEEFLRSAYAAEVPIVGVCFGHQILAQALGGTVEKFAGGWSVGPQEYRSDIFGAQRLVAWHQDQVTAVPAEAEVVGSSDFCSNAILRYGNKALTVQPHPEFSPEFMYGLLKARGHVLPDDVQTAVANSDPTGLTRDGFGDAIEQFFRTAQPAA